MCKILVVAPLSIFSYFLKDNPHLKLVYKSLLSVHILPFLTCPLVLVSVFPHHLIHLLVTQVFFISHQPQSINSTNHPAVTNLPKWCCFSFLAALLSCLLASVYVHLPLLTAAFDLRESEECFSLPAWLCLHLNLFYASFLALSQNAN